jgi:hypothetical protein
MTRRSGVWCAVLTLAATMGACAPIEGEFVPRAPVGGGSLCERACGRIYDACRLSLGTASGPLSRAECVAQCRAGGLDGYESCLSEVACSRDAVTACFLSPPIRIPTREDASAPPAPPATDASAPPPAMDGGTGTPPTPDASAPPPPPPPAPDASAPPSPMYSCSTACERIYVGCGARISQGGTPLTQTQCESLCGTDPRYANNVACLSTMECTSAAFGACLAGGGGSPPPVMDAGAPPVTDAGGMSPPPTGMCPALSGPYGRSTGNSIPDFTGVRCADGSSINYRNNVWCGARLTIVATGSFT